MGLPACTHSSHHRHPPSQLTTLTSAVVCHGGAARGGRLPRRAGAAAGGRPGGGAAADSGAGAAAGRPLLHHRQRDALQLPRWVTGEAHTPLFVIGGKPHARRPVFSRSSVPLPCTSPRPAPRHSCSPPQPPCSTAPRGGSSTQRLALAWQWRRGLRPLTTCRPARFGRASTRTSGGPGVVLGMHSLEGMVWFGLGIELEQSAGAERCAVRSSRALPAALPPPQARLPPLRLSHHPHPALHRAAHQARRPGRRRDGCAAGRGARFACTCGLITARSKHRLTVQPCPLF